jgi:hypothetical protein
MKQAETKSIKKRTRARKAAFLRAFGDNGSVTSSARLTGIDRTTHYEWLAHDAKYKEAFAMATEMAQGAALDELIRRGRIGEFRPFMYKGRLQYARRERTLCTLADGTTAFADELPQGASIIERRTVTTRGEMLGVYKRDARSLWAALAWMMPEKYGAVVWPKGKKGTH